jgi:cell division protein ZapA
MPQFEVAINGRSYVISCDEGQDQHLSRLAEYVDKRVKELVSSVGQVGEARLLVMASLLIADELSETFAKVRD